MCFGSASLVGKQLLPSLFIINQIQHGTFLLLGTFPRPVLLFSCLDQTLELLMQKTTATRTEFGIRYIQPQQGSSMSDNLCLCIPPPAGHTQPSFAHLHASLFPWNWQFNDYDLLSACRPKYIHVSYTVLGI